MTGFGQHGTDLTPVLEAIGSLREEVRGLGRRMDRLEDRMDRLEGEMKEVRKDIKTLDLATQQRFREFRQAVSDEIREALQGPQTQTSRGPMRPVF